MNYLQLGESEMFLVLSTVLSYSSYRSDYMHLRQTVLDISYCGDVSDDVKFYQKLILTLDDGDVKEYLQDEIANADDDSELLYNLYTLNQYIIDSETLVDYNTDLSYFIESQLQGLACSSIHYDDELKKVQNLLKDKKRFKKIIIYKDNGILLNQVHIAA